jgi:hypothetical protein
LKEGDVATTTEYGKQEEEEDASIWRRRDLSWRDLAETKCLRPECSSPGHQHHLIARYDMSQPKPSPLPQRRGASRTYQTCLEKKLHGQQSVFPRGTPGSVKSFRHATCDGMWHSSRIRE